MYILAIDTSCDDTSAAVLENNKVLSNVISSQVSLHQKWGGVVPDIARRAHRENIKPVIKEALKRAHIDLDKIDYFAVTYGPGLAIALEVGIEEVKQLATQYNKPLIPINHLEGHLLSSFALNSLGTNTIPNTTKDFPAIGLVVSGGHTELISVTGIGEYKLIGETLDDAAGEAFDKVAKMLNLGYPGGPIISEFSKKGNAGRFKLPTPMEKSGDLNFSYSGLKTASLYKIRDIEEKYHGKNQKAWVYDFCRDFEDAVIRSILIKLVPAVNKFNVKTVLIGGGVISNDRLRSTIRATMRRLNVKVYQTYNKKQFTDNAAMIGVAAYFKAQNKDKVILKGNKILSLERMPNAQL